MNVDELKIRQAKLQEKIQFNKRLDTVKDLIKLLSENEHDFTVVLEKDMEDIYLNWLKNEFTIMPWGRIDWSKVYKKTCLTWLNNEELVLSFLRLCSSKQLKMTTEVFLVWGNAIQPSFIIPLKKVCNYAGFIFEQDFDTWLICKDEGWVIEIYHEGEICFGESIK